MPSGAGTVERENPVVTPDAVYAAVVAVRQQFDRRFSLASLTFLERISLREYLYGLAADLARERGWPAMHAGLKARRRALALVAADHPLVRRNEQAQQLLEKEGVGPEYLAEHLPAVPVEPIHGDARAASERPLLNACFTLSSDTVSVLLTDRALYCVLVKPGLPITLASRVREVEGSFCRRWPYEKIKEISQTRTLLRIATDLGSLEVPLGWGDRKTASAIVSVLHTVLAPAAAPEGPSLDHAPVARASVNVAPNNWSAPIAFHGSAVLVGVPLYAAVLFLLASSGYFPSDVAVSLKSHSFGRLLGLSALMLAAPVYAFGLDLRFSPQRYLIVLAFMFWKMCSFVLKEGDNPHMRDAVFPVSSGLLGIGMTLALGHFGLAARRRLLRQIR